MRTDKEIEAEIEKLTTMKPRVRRRSGFGDDHHAAIDAQVEVLRNRTSEERCWDVYPDAAENVADNARQAAMWMEGSTDTPPSEDWESLVQ